MLQKLKWFFIKTLIVLTIIGALLSFGIIRFNYSEGYRVGNVIKLSQKGFLFKTFEGEIDLGFLAPQTEDGGLATRIWNFSVPQAEEEVRRKLDEAIQRNHKVKIFYHQKLLTLPWIGLTKYHVFKVEVVEGTSAILQFENGSSPAQSPK